MGTWGYKISQNDEYCDIRDSYQEKIILGYTDEMAEREVLNEFSGAGNQLWLSLAVLEWHLGRLSNDVKINALQEIENELLNIHELWDQSIIDKRIGELDRCKRLLEGKMPSRKKLRKPAWVWKCPWPIGAVLQFKIKFPKENNPYLDKYVMLAIVGISKTPQGRLPCECIAVRMYDWCGNVSPLEKMSNIIIHSPTQIDFIRMDGGKNAYHAIMPLQTMIRDNEIRCISNVPLCETPSEEINVNSPSNTVFEQIVCNTLSINHIHPLI